MVRKLVNECCKQLTKRFLFRTVIPHYSTSSTGNRQKGEQGVPSGAPLTFGPHKIVTNIIGNKPAS
jgi:hypothetical protein